MSEVTEKAPGGADTGQEPRRVVFFSAEAAPLLAETDAMEDVSPAAAVAGMSRALDAGFKNGSRTKLLFRDGKGRLSLTYVWFRSNLPLPPHTHDQDCLYYIIAGSLRYGAKVLNQGDGFFVPANIPYSYTPGEQGVELLEFRAAGAFNVALLEGTPRFWETVLQTCIANQDAWASEGPPIREPTGQG